MLRPVGLECRVAATRARPRIAESTLLTRSRKEKKTHSVDGESRRSHEKRSAQVKADTQFWSTFRSSVRAIQRSNEEIADGLRRTRTKGRSRGVLEIVGFVVALVGLGAAIVGNLQNAEAIRQNAISLDGLKDSLQRAEISSVYLSGAGWCEDPTTHAVVALSGWTVLTNSGRLPITVVHVGVERGYVNLFAYRRIDDLDQRGNGPFLLDVGDAVEVRYGIRGQGLPLNVFVSLSDGTTVATKVVGGDGNYLSELPPWEPDQPNVCPPPSVPGSHKLSELQDANGNFRLPDIQLLPNLTTD